MEILKSAGILVLANIFMTYAWYGHLKFKGLKLWQAILMSWLLALPEYMLQVPANKFGYQSLSGYQLKILQECVTICVFVIFAYFYLGERPTYRHLVSFMLIAIAVYVAFSGKEVH